MGADAGGNPDTRAPCPWAGSDAYVRACALAGVRGGRVAALDRLRRFYRDGDAAALGISVGGDGPGDVGGVVRREVSPSSEGDVVKFTQRVGSGKNDGRTFETESVVIPMIGEKGRLTHTLCVSSQVGCAMGCGFCQTAQMGLVKNLSVREIVQQWWAARHVIGFETITNVVFMGMGEPMDNLDNVIGAIRVLADHNCCGLAMSKISVSTVGRVDGIERLGRRVHEPGWHRLSLAVSLNGSNDAVRSSIMPVNRAMPMRRLREAIMGWPRYGSAKICLEYVLIPGVNDLREHARELGEYVTGRGAYEGQGRIPGMVNVIPYNPREDSPWEAPREEDVDLFVAWLMEEDVYVKRRRTKGRETMAACGQLGNLAYRRENRGGKRVGLRVKVQ